VLLTERERERERERENVDKVLRVRGCRVCVRVFHMLICKQD